MGWLLCLASLAGPFHHMDVRTLFVRHGSGSLDPATTLVVLRISWRVVGRSWFVVRLQV